MAGLALGAFSFNRMVPVPSEKKYFHIQISLALFSLGFSFCHPGAEPARNTCMMVQAVFVSLTLILSFITGLEFSLASAIGGKDITLRTSFNYSADLFGSAIGAIVTTLLLLPFLGFVASCLVMVAMNLFSAGFLYFGQNKS